MNAWTCSVNSASWRHSLYLFSVDFSFCETKALGQVSQVSSPTYSGMFAISNMYKGYQRSLLLGMKRYAPVGAEKDGTRLHWQSFCLESFRTLQVI